MMAPLAEISTHWSRVSDPAQFAMRYASAVRAFLGRHLPDPNDADDVAQEIFVQVATRGFSSVDRSRGRFRNYLAVCVRNAARAYLKKKSRLEIAEELPEPPAVEANDADLSEWRRCLIDRAMRTLHGRERSVPGNMFHTVLRVRGEMPEADSKAQADRVEKMVGRPINPAAYRKQVSRAMKAFAWLITCEVAETVEPPDAVTVEAELRETGLFSQIADYLPEDWRNRPFARDFAWRE